MQVTDERAQHLEQLKGFLTEVLDLEEDFSETDHFMDDLGLSSLMGLEVMVALEKEYSIKFQEEEVKQLTTLLNVYDALREKNAAFK